MRQPWAAPAAATSLALKLTSTRRVSHVYDIAADPGAALFAGLTALPKTTALTSYSYRLERALQAAFVAALDTLLDCPAAFPVSLQMGGDRLDAGAASGYRDSALI